MVKSACSSLIRLDRALMEAIFSRPQATALARDSELIVFSEVGGAGGAALHTGARQAGLMLAAVNGSAAALFT